MPSTRTSRSIRRLTTVVAAGVTFSILPLPLVSVVDAQAPATAVTGLALGARGDAVKQVQQALVNQGIAVSGGIDGVFGPGTQTALKEFQAKKGLSQSGSVDLATALALGLESSSLLGLTQGTTGANVTALQNKLAAAGYRPAGGADGIFGPATATALTSFQAAKGLGQTASVDASTAAALAGVSGGATEAPAPQPAATPTATGVSGLQIGSRGDAVKQLQQSLMGLGFTVVGGADGIFGVLTANAVKSFQNANGIATTGAVDDATAAALAASTGSGGATHDPTVSSSPFVGLRYGSLGADVKGLQQALIDAGISVRGGADGVYGMVTVAAVKDFQSKHGIGASGTVDEATANALASRDPGAASSASIVGLTAGALGNTVKNLQQKLIDAGVTVRGGADGIFGPATASALKSFQTSQGLSATGVVDDATAAALANPKAPVTGGSSSGSTDGYAQFGEKGARVTSLQSALVKAGVPLRGGVDGDFGGGTSAAVMEFQRQRGIPVSGKVDAATASALGLSTASAPTAPDPSSVDMKVFPVQGKCYFGDSFGYPRSGGRTHLGTDLMAAQGNLLYAVADGRITKVYYDYPGSLAGNGVQLTMPDGTYYFYAHMSELGPGIDVGVPVTAGQVVGKVGSTGNAGTSHLHIEIHPKGGAAVNPYPLLKAIDACNVTAPRG
jgi:peptidoglycan hydrolase-like protein with peptidoglycan-binding domain